MVTETIRVEFDSRAVSEALDRLAQAAWDPRGALELIGECLVESAKERFGAEVAPSGARWPQNSDVTILRYLDSKGGLGKKRLASGGRNLTAKGAKLLGAKKILQQSGLLRDSISYRLVPGGVEVGTNRIYGAMMQFGGSKSQWPNLWGDIPARPFLGLSADDEKQVLDIIRDHLSGTLGRS